MTKKQYLLLCMGQTRQYLESACFEYDAGNVAGMRPIHRAIVAIALRHKL